MMRDMSNIIEKIIKLIPDEAYMLKDGLKREVERIIRSSKFQAPEADGGLWYAIEQALQNYLGNVADANWCKEIIALWNDNK